MSAAIPKFLWLAVIVSIAAIAGSWATYRADIDFFPSIFIFVSAMFITGAFATLEDYLLKRVNEVEEDRLTTFGLCMVRAGRSILLLALGIAMFVLLVSKIN